MPGSGRSLALAWALSGGAGANERDAMGIAERQVGTMVWIAAWVILAAAYFISAPEGTFDLRADRLTALAVLDGADPYVAVDHLAHRYGSDLRGWTHVHPRTPGALVLQTPLAMIPESGLRYMALAGSALAIVATVAVALRVWPVRPLIGLAICLGVGVTSVAVEAAAVGAQSSVLALFLAVGWWRLRDGDDPWAGLAVGLAVTLKIFPWLLLIVLLARRKQAAGAAVVTLGALNGVGLLIPGVTLTGAFDAVSSANLSASAGLNASAARYLGESLPVEVLSLGLAAAGAAAAVAFTSSKWDFDRQWFAVLAVSVAVSPLIWRHYALVLIPALIWLWARGGRTGMAIAVVAALCLLVPMPLVSVWLILPVAVGVAVGAATARPPASAADPEPAIA